MLAVLFVVTNDNSYLKMLPETEKTNDAALEAVPGEGTALAALETLEVKGRAPKTGYERTLFGSSWLMEGSCDTRNLILNRDLKTVVIDDKCRVLQGTLDDPYTGKTIEFKRGTDTSKSVQIDHVVALNDAWQKGAQQFSAAKRLNFANDPLELLAVDGPANQEKSNGDAATWLPSNKAFRCQYVARQVAVKQKYQLWVTKAEKDTIRRVLSSCPDEPIPVAKKSL